jgi:uncharacterized cupredoxin-like copper-binding protein
MHGGRRLAVLAACVGLLPVFAACGARAGAAALGPGEVTVELDLRYSRFTPAELTIRDGTLVRFVVRNRDPIRHELIVGPPEVQARHRNGTEAVHPPVPGEVTVDPGTVAETTFHVHGRDDIEFACHLPGHYQYGMRGTIHVVD